MAATDGSGDEWDVYHDPESIAAILMENGIAEFIFSSTTSQLPEATVRDIEDEARRMIDAFGSGAHPFYWLAGRFYDADPDFKTFDSEIWEGVKVHELETPWVKERPNDLNRILSILEERGMPVQFHAGEDFGCHPKEILPFIKQHPKLRVDLAHCRPCTEMIECLKEMPSLFTDTAFMLPEHYPELAEAGVLDQVMFGTDLPVQARYQNRPLPDLYREELESAWQTGFCDAVMSGNFQKFLWGQVK